jgi:hypothetical protein
VASPKSCPFVQKQQEHPFCESSLKEEKCLNGRFSQNLKKKKKPVAKKKPTHNLLHRIKM